MVRNTIWLFAGFGLLGIAGVIALALVDKGGLFLYFALERKPLLDWLAGGANYLGEASAFIVAFFLLRAIRLRYALLIPLLGLLTTLTSKGLKFFFAQPRPRTVFYKLVDSGEIVSAFGGELHGGYNSFPSGHTMAAFALFTFIALWVGNRWWSMLCLLLATLAGLARIVLSQHFLEDVYAGAFCGVVLAVTVFYTQSKWPKTYRTR